MGEQLRLGGVSLRDTSKERAAYDVIRRGIILRELEPGRRLIPADVGRELGLSSMPVRNALMRLEAERLVTRSPHKEFLVAPYSSEEIRELYAVRLVLDGLAARLAAERITPDGIARLRAIIERSEQYEADEDMESLEAASREFHMTLYTYAGNGELLGLIRALQDRGARYRVPRYVVVREAGIKALREHHQIVSALEEGKTDMVEELIKTDLESTAKALLRVVEERPLVLSDNTRKAAGVHHGTA